MEDLKQSNEWDREGWDIVWQDEFDGASLDINKWSHEVGGHGFGNNELQYYTDDSSNSFVDNGDTLYVPKYSNTIAVVGEVYEPGTFRFEEGLTLEQYLQIAGGTTRYAIKSSTYLLKADGSVRFYRSNRLKNLLSFDAGATNSIEAGDAIVIPTNLDYDPPLTRVSAITGVVFQSLTSIAAFLNITRQ